ncbi:MAG: hypothetical protein LAO79_11885 [Acidobacteriia bacterium]|nr:hypothetical protein [Terriglobia bacterium]
MKRLGYRAQRGSAQARSFVHDEMKCAGVDRLAQVRNSMERVACRTDGERLDFDTLFKQRSRDRGAEAGSDAADADHRTFSGARVCEEFFRRIDVGFGKKAVIGVAFGNADLDGGRQIEAQIGQRPRRIDESAADFECGSTQVRYGGVAGRKQVGDSAFEFPEGDEKLSSRIRIGRPGGFEHVRGSEDSFLFTVNDHRSQAIPRIFKT